MPINMLMRWANETYSTNVATVWPDDINLKMFCTDSSIDDVEKAAVAHKWPRLSTAVPKNFNVTDLIQAIFVKPIKFFKTLLALPIFVIAVVSEK